MKKIGFYIIIPLAILFSASLLTGKPTRKELKVKQVYEIPFDDSIHNLSKSQQDTSDSSMKAELNYYMERHNLQDDGYEMVVAFAGGRRHQVDIDHYVPIWNVGSWQGLYREGTALALDSLGRTIVGTCHEDSLITAV